MSSVAYDVRVDKDLRDLVPSFLTNRRKELELLRAALKTGDLEQIRQLGHRMKGVGLSYGFDYISELGKELELSAKVSDQQALNTAVGAYSDYLAKVRISFA